MFQIEKVYYRFLDNLSSDSVVSLLLGSAKLIFFS